MPKRRTKSKTNSSITLLALVVLFILGIYYSLTGRDPGGVFGTGTQTPTLSAATQPSPVVNAPTALNASGAWWEVYFADPVNMRDPANWPEPMRLEWGDDKGITTHKAHKTRVFSAFRKIRKEIDAFNIILFRGLDGDRRFRDAFPLH